MSEPTDADAKPPLLRVVRGGEPTPEEVAALVTALTARTVASPGADRTTGSQWASRAAALRRPLRPGPGAWARSGRRDGAG